MSVSCKVLCYQIKAAADSFATSTSFFRSQAYWVLRPSSATLRTGQQWPGGDGCGGLFCPEPSPPALPKYATEASGLVLQRKQVSLQWGQWWCCPVHVSQQPFERERERDRMWPKSGPIGHIVYSCHFLTDLNNWKIKSQRRRGRHGSGVRSHSCSSRWPRFDS